jgi:Lrp/AsnC family transcriptional regulator, regulator for asnA, asnC and gidA
MQSRSGGRTREWVFAIVMTSDSGKANSASIASAFAVGSRGQIRPVLNVNKAGRTFVYCKLAINSVNLADTLRTLAQRQEFVTVASIFGGKFNAFVYFTYGDMDELHGVINNLLMPIEGLSEIETSVISASPVFSPTYLNYDGAYFEADVQRNADTLRSETQKCDVDDLDILIISELQCNTRKSLRAIARDLDVSPGTIRYRLQRLERDNIIQFIALNDSTDMELTCFTIVEMRVDPAAFASIVAELSDKPWLSHLHEVIGTTDLIAFVNASDLREAQRLISDNIRAVAGVRSVAVRIFLDTYKVDPRWGFLPPKD